MAGPIIALFNTQVLANAAIRDLEVNGFASEKVGLVVKDMDGGTVVSPEADAALRPAHTTEDAVAGGLIGGTVGAFLAATGALVIPGIGPFISGGILVALIGGGAGWLVGGLAGLGIPEEDARYYQEQVEDGRSLVTVIADGLEEDAVRILLRHGGEVNRLGGTGLPTGDRESALAAPGTPSYATTANAASGPKGIFKTEGDESRAKAPTDPPIGLKAEAAPPSAMLAPTDPRRASPEGQPMLDEANPRGLDLKNREDRPMGGLPADRTAEPAI